tara:strand:- start:3465 stop:4367 length:903 start_codon:yes stop_codon:yes gene_type:complete
MDLSIIIPIYNEEENIEKLYYEIIKSVKSVAKFEVIFIDDGSSDNSLNVLNKLKKNNKIIEVFSFRENQGQTTATLKGFELSKGDYIVPLDGDLQNDPSDIDKLIIKFKTDKLDILFGVRHNRKDNFLRMFLSSVANKLIKFLFDKNVSDLGCSMRCYKKKVIKNLFINNEQHRILPIILISQNYNYSEIELNHRPRKFGVSKYNYSRVYKIFIDLLIYYLIKNYSNKPFYLFGKVSLFFLFLFFISFFYMIYLKVFMGQSFILTPLPILSAVLICISIISVLVGFACEILIREYKDFKK